MNVEPKITVNQGKYLKFIYQKQHEELSQVKTTALAKAIGVRPASVTEMLQKLAKKGLLRYTRHRGITLTKEGIVEAKRLLRKHRLLEVLFVRALDYDAKNACDEASKMDYYVSEHLINTVSRTYGYPKICPCNKTIFHNQECRE